mmetsp:Transcript_21133/g.42120  ORF Transcript_21133/g.42120 Transcript_21133/m.42120 type:complete len:267 (+) Transcript_21133:185-985(+)
MTKPPLFVLLRLLRAMSVPIPHRCLATTRPDPQDSFDTSTSLMSHFTLFTSTFFRSKSYPSPPSASDPLSLLVSGFRMRVSASLLLLALSTSSNSLHDLLLPATTSPSIPLPAPSSSTLPALCSMPRDDRFARSDDSCTTCFSVPRGTIRLRILGRKPADSSGPDRSLRGRDRVECMCITALARPRSSSAALGAPGSSPSPLGRFNPSLYHGSASLCLLSFSALHLFSCLFHLPSFTVVPHAGHGIPPLGVWLPQRRVLGRGRPLQ